MNYKKTLAPIGASIMAAGTALATAAIENDTLDGLPQVGTDLGDFLSNLAPGLGTFLLILGIFLGVIGIIGGIAFVIVAMIKKVKMGGR